MRKLPLLAVILVVSLCGCFGMDRKGGIIRYSDGKAYTARGTFQSGRLPAPWKGPSVKLKQLVYENDELSATILADALCGEKFIDAPLNRLAKDLFDRMESQKIENPEEFNLDGRVALKMTGQGAVDGVPIKMQVVVMKRDFCLYDFVYFSSPKYFNQGLKDFNRYLDGFTVR